MTGALEGIRIIEIAGIGPAPFAGMMLADHGAEVIRVDRPGGTRGGVPTAREADVLARSRASIVLDLKSAEGAAVFRDLCATADALIEGFRPGVMERLGLGPDQLLAANPRLVYGRMTGWGQDGPYAQSAGHDINYIALAGVLNGIGRAGEKPVPPANLIGDFGGGGMILAFGVLAAIIAAGRTGRGQVVDCAMSEGAALLSAMLWGFKAQGHWHDTRGVNTLDGGAPYYDSYETADGKHIAFGPIEPQFYAEFCRRAGLDGDPAFSGQLDPSNWPALKQRLEEVFAAGTRDEWCTLLEGSDACFAPVLSMDEAPHHPHNRARSVFAAIGGVTQPMPAPRFSATPAADPEAPGPAGRESRAILAGLGYSQARIDALVEQHHEGAE
jgi:alpha-methylacyl-CoA racemase